MVDHSGAELKDYKFMCFNGKVKCIFTCTDRYAPEGLKVTFFDTRKWERMPFKRHYPIDKKTIEKPHSFDEMVHLSEKLSKGIPFVRSWISTRSTESLIWRDDFLPRNRYGRVYAT